MEVVKSDERMAEALKPELTLPKIPLYSELQ